ncbi:MAG: metalloregulator ArsR/SmtB family transcription factor [Balneolales bacterium]
MNTRDFKHRIYSELAIISKALSNPHRMEIIELLAQGPGSVEHIAENTETSIANASQHLQTLKAARLVKTEKKGKYSYYSLADIKVYNVWNAMRDLGMSQNAEVEKLIHNFRKSRHNLESVTMDQLLERVQGGKALVLDVRPQSEYNEGHISTALSIPHDELLQHLSSLPKNKEIVAYCRGPLCALADDAIKVLNEHGYRAIRLEVGYPEWSAKGFPVEN